MGSGKTKLSDELAKWIDSGVIADVIMWTLEDWDLPLTSTQAKDLWYRALEQLSDFLSGIAESQQESGVRKVKECPSKPSTSQSNESGEEQGDEDDVPF
jgi:hypothetical protein